MCGKREARGFGGNEIGVESHKKQMNDDKNARVCFFAKATVFKKKRCTFPINGTIGLCIFQTIPRRAFSSWPSLLCAILHLLPRPASIPLPIAHSLSLILEAYSVSPSKCIEPRLEFTGNITNSFTGSDMYLDAMASFYLAPLGVKGRWTSRSRLDLARPPFGERSSALFDPYSRQLLPSFCHPYTIPFLLILAHLFLSG